MTAAFFTGAFYPVDDLARHVKSDLYGFDFRVLYSYSYHPAFNTYVFFDIVISWLYRHIGASSYYIFQMVPFALTMTAVIRMSRGASRNLVSLVVLFVFYFMWNRFQSGRPCVLVSSIFLFALAFKDNMRFFAHCFIGVLLASIYYLFFLYTIPMLILGKKERNAYLCATVSGVVFWYIFSRGEYLNVIVSLFSSMSPEGLQYAELKPIFSIESFVYVSALMPFFTSSEKI